MTKYLIDNWPQLPKMLTTWVGTACIIFGSLPETTQAEVLRLFGVPEHRLIGVVGIMVLVARAVKQAGLSAAAPAPADEPESAPEDPTPPTDR